MNIIKTKIDYNSIEYIKNEFNDCVEENLEEKIDLLDKFLCLDKDGSCYEGLNDKLVNTIKALSSDEITPLKALREFSITEQFVKSLIYLVDKKKYEDIIANNEAFKNSIIYIDLIRLNKNNNLDLKLTNRDKEYYNSIEDKFRYPKYPKNQIHWARAYELRNEEAHACKKYSTKEVYTYLGSILHVLLESLWKFRDDIERIYYNNIIFGNIKIDEYYNKIIKQYEDKNLNNTFVVMNKTKVDHKNSWFASSIEEEDDEGDNEDESILDIMNTEENYIKLMGEAGIGKTRVLKQLQYIDAKNRKYFPIYVQLKHLSDTNISLMELIYEESGLDKEACKELLRRGGVHLYLDGVNEILCSDKVKRILCSQIDNLANNYPKAKILVSDRESSQVTVSFDIPTYLLCKLDKYMINEFIKINSKTIENEQATKSILERNLYIYDIVKTPFLLECFMDVITRGYFNEDITNENQLIKVFIQQLIYREASEKKEIRADKIEMLLTHLFANEYKTVNNRVRFKKPNLLKNFNECAETFGFGVDTLEVLELIVQMGLLEYIKNDNSYVFPNEFYENYFYNEAIEWVE